MKKIILILLISFMLFGCINQPAADQNTSTTAPQAATNTTPEKKVVDDSSVTIPETSDITEQEAIVAIGESLESEDVNLTNIVITNNEIAAVINSTEEDFLVDAELVFEYMFLNFPIFETYTVDIDNIDISLSTSNENLLKLLDEEITFEEFVDSLEGYELE